MNCDICKRKEITSHASHRCDICDENYCQQCAETHTYYKVFKDHKLTPTGHPGNHERTCAGKTAVKGSAANKSISGTFREKFNIRLNGERKTCKVSGITCLPNGRVVLVDSQNRKLKVFGSGYEFIMSTGILKGSRGIASISGNEVAIAQWEKVQCYEINESEIVKIPKFFSIDGSGLAISYERNHYAVSYKHKENKLKYVKIMDKYSENCSHIENGQVFNQPMEISGDIQLNPNEDTVFISDSGTPRTICFTYSGEPLWYVKADYDGFTVIGKSLMMSKFATNKIQAIDCEDGQTIDVKLGDNGTVRRPFLLAYQTGQSRLLVSHNVIDGDDISVYAIKEDGGFKFPFPCSIL